MTRPHQAPAIFRLQQYSTNDFVEGWYVWAFQHKKWQGTAAAKAFAKLKIRELGPPQRWIMKLNNSEIHRRGGFGGLDYIIVQKQLEQGGGKEASFPE